jgi:hypothetical protein
MNNLIVIVLGVVAAAAVVRWWVKSKATGHWIFRRPGGVYPEQTLRSYDLATLEAVEPKRVGAPPVTADPAPAPCRRFVVPSAKAAPTVTESVRMVSAVTPEGAAGGGPKTESVKTLRLKLRTDILPTERRQCE